MIDRRRWWRIYVRLWRNPDFRALPEGERLLTLYLMSGPQTNRVGLFHFSAGTAAEDFDAMPADIRTRLVHVVAAFAWEFDARAHVLWIPSWWSFNPPGENLKNVKGYLSDLNDVPRTPLIHRFCTHLVDVPEVVRFLFAEWEQKLAPREPCSNGDAITVRSLRQDKTETETETREDTESAEPSNGSTPPAAPREPVEARRGTRDDSPTVLVYPTIGSAGPTWQLSEAQVAEWATLYPGLDVVAECRKALAWVQADLNRRKTGKGMTRFLVNWLNRTTDRGGPAGRGVTPGSLKTAGNPDALRRFAARGQA